MSGSQEDLLIVLFNTSCESAYKYAEKIRFAIKSLTIQYNAQIIPLTASLGVTGFPEQGETVTSLLQIVYQSLYIAKKAGGDQVYLAKIPMIITIDHLTGLYNRCYAEEALEETLNLAKAEKLSVAMIMIDLGYFRKINNNFGLAAGDLVLQKLAELLKNTFKDSAILARYWGDVFLVILPNTNLNSAYSLAEKLRRAIKSLEIKYNEQIITLTASFSFGEVCYTKNQMTIVGYFWLYSSSSQTETTREILSDLSKALYKPIIKAGLDGLTGLGHPRHLEKTFSKIIPLAKKEGLSLAIIMLDIDYFKQINDRFGHAAGNLVLETLGKLLKTTFKDDGIPFRYGGEEFLVLLPNTSRESAYEQAEKLRLAIRALEINYNAQTITLTASFGVAGFPEQGETMASILEAADHVLYEAKSDGRDRVYIAGIPIIIDKLTGLYNGRYAYKYLEETISLTKSEGSSLAIIVLVIDSFFSIRASFSYLTADLIIQKIAEWLKNTLRDSDIVCRYEEDKFLIIPLNTNTNLVDKIAEELRLAIKSLEIKYDPKMLSLQRDLYNNKPITVTVSFGVACFLQEGEIVESILEEAIYPLLDKAESDKRSESVELKIHQL